jgi:hypothetical protein
VDLSSRLANDLKTAMKSGETLRRDVIRFLLSSVKNREIEFRRPLSEEEAIEVVQTQIKQRRDSIDAFEKAGRIDLAEKETSELEILMDYLPGELRPLDESQLRELVVRTVEELGLAGPADMRTLMPALIRETEGRADNRLLSKLANEELQKRSR